MVKEVVEQRKEEVLEKIQNEKDKLMNLINTCPFYSDDDRKMLLNELDHCSNDVYLLDTRYSHFQFLLTYTLLDLIKDGKVDDNEDFKQWMQTFSTISSKDLQKYLSEYYAYDRYIDSEPMEFEGDIVITDPCYLMKEKSDEEREYYRNHQPNEDDYHSGPIETYPDVVDHEYFKTSELYDAEQMKYQQDLNKFDSLYGDDWQRCEYGDNMGILGIHKHMTRDTLYGDWSCNVFKQKSPMNTEEFIKKAREGFNVCEYDRETDDKIFNDSFKEIGGFCADAGLVTVADMSEVLKYNPDFEDWCKEHKWCAFVLKNFKGTAQYIVREYHGVYDWESEYHKLGDTYIDYFVEVIISGINTVTGEKINLIGTQTNL